MAGDLTGAPIPPEPAPRYAALDLDSSRHTEKELRTASFLEAFRTGHIDPARAVVRSSKNLPRGIRALNARALSTPYAAYDGVIGPREELAESLRRLSPGRLETFALCPFRFFMEYVLETGAVEEPELPVDMDRKEVGSAYHRILYRLFSALKREGLLPISDAAVEEAKGRLFPIIDDELKHRMGPIPALVERARREAITENLLAVLDHEAGRSPRGAVPNRFEWRFGSLPSEYDDDMPPPLLLETPAGPVEITGSVDRIDVDEKHRAFEVVDYKTRRPSSPKLATRIQKGLSLQLPLYLLAARDVLFSGDSSPRGASLIYLEEPDEKNREEHIDTTGAPEILDAALSHVFMFVMMMHRGVFFPAGVEPDKGCRFCDHKDHCRSGSKGIARFRKNRTMASLGIDTTNDEGEDTDD
jgi:RecB family exonuclease